MNNTQRELAMNLLADDDFNFIMNGSGAELLDSYLRNGFRGYYEYTDEELIAELESRGLPLEADDENIDIQIDNISHIGE